MLSTLVAPALGSATAGYLIGGIVLGIAALSIVFPLIKPTLHLPGNAEEWTAPFNEKEWTSGIRKQVQKKIAETLRRGKHPLLIGPSRVGKSLTAYAFAQAVKRGEHRGFKGMRVFHYSAADLAKRKPSFLGGNNDILDQISNAMGRHRNNTILVFDEIHAACQTDSNLAEQFKQFLERGGRFPHVIGITTEEEYERYVKPNRALTLRFEKIIIENSNEDETFEVMLKTLFQDPSQHVTDDSVLKYIFQKASAEDSAPQPQTSTDILQKCMDHISQSQISESPQKRTMSVIGEKIRGLGLQTDAGDQISRLKEELSRLETEIMRSEQSRTRLFQLKATFDQTVENMYRMIWKVATLAPTTRKVQRNQKLLLLLRRHLIPMMQAVLTEKSRELGIQMFIDKSVVDMAAVEKKPPCPKARGSEEH